MQIPDRLRVGTRGSPLALAQAHEVRDRLLAAHPGLAPEAVEIVTITTSGDRIQSKALREFGGKGLFTKEIEEALYEDRIDLAVHSMKDMPTVLPDGLAITCLLPREDPRDVFLSPRADSLEALPSGSVVGTASLRRQAQLRHRRPDLQVVTFRGSVNTRLRKLAEGEADATFLALAGLRRLAMADRATAPVPVETMLPAVAQGAIGIEIRENDRAVADALTPLHDRDTEIRLAAERAFLAALDGSCRTPIAGLALIEGDEVWFRGQILRPDGSESLEIERRGPPGEAAALGREAGESLKARAGDGFLDETS